MTAPLAPRDRLVLEMAGGLERRGLHGTGVAELLLAARSPRGVLYHHFPGGKAELAAEALRVAGARLVADLARPAEAGSPDTPGSPDALDTLGPDPDADPVAVLRGWLERAGERLEASGFLRGCPLGVTALETVPDDEDLRAVLATAFDTLRHRVTGLLWRAGARPDDAARLATLVVAGYEGGLMQARVAGSLLPLHQVTDLLAGLVDDVLAAAHAEAADAATAPETAIDTDAVQLALPDTAQATSAVLLPEAAPLPSSLPVHH